jgi:hypothetical protein
LEDFLSTEYFLFCYVRNLHTFHRIFSEFVDLLLFIPVEVLLLASDWGAVIILGLVDQVADLLVVYL